MHLGTLRPNAPYDFGKILAFTERHPVVTGRVRDGAYWLAVPNRSAIALVRVASEAGGALGLYLMAATGTIEHDALLAQMRAILQVDSEIAGFAAFARDDAQLWAVVEPLIGLRFVQVASLFEALVITIIEQQITLAAAQRAQRWLVEWGGRAIHYDGEDFYAFPQAEQIAAAGLDDLKALKITTRRMETLRECARMHVSGKLDLEALAGQPKPLVYDALMAIKGVGHWTATWALIRGLGYYQYVAENDVALQAAVNHYFLRQDGRPSPKAVKAFFEQYGEFAGQAAFHVLMRWERDYY